MPGPVRLKLALALGLCRRKRGSQFSVVQTAGLECPEARLWVLLTCACWMKTQRGSEQTQTAGLWQAAARLLVLWPPQPAVLAQAVSAGWQTWARPGPGQPIPKSSD